MANETGAGGGGNTSPGVRRRRENIRRKNEERRAEVLADLVKDAEEVEARAETHRHLERGARRRGHATAEASQRRKAEQAEADAAELRGQIRAVERVEVSEQELVDDGFFRDLAPVYDNMDPARPDAVDRPRQAGPPAPDRGPGASTSTDRPATPAPSTPAAPVADTGTAPAAAPAAGAGSAPEAPLAPGAPNPDGKFGIPGGAQVWENKGDGYWYVVYTIPGSNPPVPLAWRIENDDDVAAIFGPGNEWKVDRALSADEWKSEGVLSWGPSRMLANLSEHPFDAFVANFATEAQIRPWLRDPEILALTVRGMLEGREVTEAELATTDWWQSRTAGERAWMAEVNKDPRTAQQKVQDQRNSTRRLMISLGISEPPEQLVNLISDRITGGTWSAAYAQEQISLIADPAAPGAMDATVEKWVANLADRGVSLNTLADNTTKVDTLVRKWLGPVIAAGWTDTQKRDWAGRLRNDPQAEQELIDQLKRQRLVMFPEYENPDLAYDDIAAPWRSVVTQTWGQQMDETDPLFARVVRTNDLSKAEQMLRNEGLKRGVGQVVESALRDVGAALGGGVQRVA